MKDGSCMEEQQAKPWEESDEPRALIYIGNADMSEFSLDHWQVP